MNQFITIFLPMLMLMGCASQATVDEFGRVVIHNFGYVKIIKPPVFPAEKEINVTGARLIGFSIGEGFTLGYKASEYMKIPTDCRVLVVVADKSQLEHLINEFSLIGGNELCATISTQQ